MTQIDEKQIAALKGSITKLENEANALAVTNQEEYEKAIDLVARMKAFSKSVKERKEAITKPLNEALRNVRSMFQPVEDELENAEAEIKGKLLEYKREQDRIAQEKAEKIADRVERGTMTLATGEKRIEEVQQQSPGTHTKTAVGQIQIRRVRKVQITDEMAIPRKYLVPDLGAIRRDALAGIEIPGVETYDEEIVAAGLR